MVCVVAPEFHKYAVAPLAVSVVACPEQMAAVPVILTVGSALTVTILVADAEQPRDVPVAVYVVVLPGLTLILIVVAALLHK